MKKFIDKVLYSLVLFVSFVLNAQTQTPPPPGEESSDVGGISQPVNMYVIALAVVAVMFIIYFAKQNNKKVA